MVNLREYSPLAKWLINQIRPHGPYASIRDLTIAAGLSQNTLHLVVEGGRGTRPETLRKLATMTEIPIIDLYVIAGWITEEEAGSVPAPTGSHDEQCTRLLLSELPPASAHAWLKIGHALVDLTKESKEEKVSGEL